MSKMSKSGPDNPNWKGGLLEKLCEVCAHPFKVKRVHASARFCSMQCVGVSQRGRVLPKRARVQKDCAVCSAPFEIYASHAARRHSCSPACYRVLRSKIAAGENNGNWHGGISRLPYPHDFSRISRRIIERDGGKCRNPNCAGTDQRMTTHHINYQKHDCRDENLIALCSACNSKANFARERWQQLYEAIAAEMYPFRFKAVKALAKKHGGGWSEELFA